MLLAALPVCGLTAARLAAQDYRVIDLGTLGGTQSRALAVNDQGQVVGWSETGTATRAFIWDSLHGMRALGTLGGANSRAYAINSAGQVVGEADTPDATHAFVWEPGGGLRDLGTLGGANSGALHINNHGQIVGWAETGETAPAPEMHAVPPPDTGSELPVQHACLWDGDALIDLGTIDGPNSRALAINDNGRIVGWAETMATFGDAGPCSAEECYFERRAFEYSAGTLTVLPSYRPAARREQANDINNHDEILGGSWIMDGAFIGPGVLYQDGTVVGTIPWTRPYTYFYAINDVGQVVGGDSHAVLYEAGTVVNLNERLRSDTKWSLYAATGINERGQIAGWGYNGDQMHAFLLTRGGDLCGAGACGAGVLGWLPLTAAGIGVLKLRAYSSGRRP